LIEHFDMGAAAAQNFGEAGITFSLMLRQPLNHVVHRNI
jgi:hypothetical protein